MATARPHSWLTVVKAMAWVALLAILFAMIAQGSLRGATTRVHHSAVVVESALSASVATGLIVSAQDEYACDDNDPESCEAVIYYPGLCQQVEPYGYWYYFWNCHERDGETLAAETATIETAPDGQLTTTVERTYRTGDVRRFSRRHPSPKSIPIRREGCIALRRAA